VCHFKIKTIKNKKNRGPVFQNILIVSQSYGKLEICAYGNDRKGNETDGRGPPRTLAFGSSEF